MGKTNICRSVRRWLLLLLLLPASVCAKDVSQAMLYIEKTDGSVVQIPITTGYPVLRHTFSYEGDKMVPSLDVTYKLQEVQFMIIPHAQIRPFYTGFETSDIVEMESSKYVMQESEGKNWKYDYETFVRFDKKGLQQYVESLTAAGARSTGGGKLGHEREKEWLRPLPPVFVPGTWRDALKK